MKRTILIFLVTFILIGCNEIENSSDKPFLEENDAENLEITKKIELQLFSEIIFFALESNEGLRKFVKEEGLKKFNKDSDILLAIHLDGMIKDKTLFEILESYNHRNLNLSKFFKENPLITLFIPSLPNGFNIDTWDEINEIPAIAYNLEGNTVLFSEDGRNELEDGLIPGFPTIVLKENERVVIDTSNKRSFARINGHSYSFIDAFFDGRVKNDDLNKSSILWNLFYDPKIINVRNQGDVWQRDYVYFNISQNQPSGLIDRSYREQLYTIEFNNSGGYAKISNDYSGLNGVTKDQKIINENRTTGWTDGLFEFKVSVVTNDLNNVNSFAETRFFQASGSDLFNLGYTTYTAGCGFLRRCTFYRLASINPKEFWIPNSVIFPIWDIAKYSTEWKFFFEEVDSNVSFEVIESNSVKKAANVELSGSFGDIFKIGSKYGASIEQTKSVSSKRTFNQSNNDLGNQTIYWYDPFVQVSQLSPPEYFYSKITPLKYQTGWLKFTVLPAKQF